MLKAIGITLVGEICQLTREEFIKRLASTFNTYAYTLKEIEQIMKEEELHFVTKNI